AAPLRRAGRQFLDVPVFDPRGPLPLRLREGLGLRGRSEPDGRGPGAPGVPSRDHPADAPRDHARTRSRRRTLQLRGGRFCPLRPGGLAPARGTSAPRAMILFETASTPSVRTGEFELASRRVAARAFPYAGEVGGARFRFDPVERRFFPRAPEGTVLAGP